MTLGPGDFAHYFRAVHGHDPFPWQQALVDLLAKNDSWPQVLDLPTGAGKTAALDIAVFHLALRADEPWKAALRIALVVDRRLVVDDSFERATKISGAFAEPPNGTERGGAVVREMARRLQLLAGPESPPLVACRLRGGAPLEHDWARTPTQPTILCSTVDQVGSRLLFRGYGVSNRMKPVHAGLLGSDSLILLDEAHLSEPFRQTLADVQAIGHARIKTALLSATPGVSEQSNFALTADDRDHPILKTRLEASKPVRLEKPIWTTAADVFADAALKMADRLRAGGVPAPAVGIVVNRVDLARTIFDKLRNESNVASDSLLMIGRARDIDRDRIASRLSPYRTGCMDRNDAAPLFVVATQCLEVGVDLDLDGLVTQAAPLDALRQRFGRLNRAGRAVPAAGAILAIAEDLAKKADDPIYGDRIRKTWDALSQIAEDSKLDFGVTAFERRLNDAALNTAELAAPRAQAPVLMPAYLGLWSQTSPPPAVDPEVGLFLHGSERPSAEVSLAWRSDIIASDLKERNGVNRVRRIMEIVPPRAAEMIKLPIWSVTAWLQGGQAERAARIADVPARDESDRTGRPALTRKNAFRWAGSDDPRTEIVSSEDLRPGDVLIVPAEYGGCDEFGWNPKSESPVGDVADEAALPYRHRRYAVRVTPDTVRKDSQWGWERVARVLAASEGTDSRDLPDLLLDALPVETADADAEPAEQRVPQRSIREPLMAIRGARITSCFPYDREDPASGEGDLQLVRGAILVAPQGLNVESDTDEPATPVTEDETFSHTSRQPGQPVTVDDHCRDVVAYVEHFTQTLGLPAKVAADLRLAAFLHDAGKADSRFQIMLSGGDLWNRSSVPALAKSGRPPSPHARERAGLPDGWRHEALSVRMAMAHPRFTEAHDPALVLWLIGTHHGLGRPFFGFADPHEETARHDLSACLDVVNWRVGTGPGPQSLAFGYDGLDWAMMFQRLMQRYGTWELARMETILRLADHRASDRSAA